MNDSGVAEMTPHIEPQAASAPEGPMKTEKVKVEPWIDASSEGKENPLPEAFEGSDFSRMKEAQIAKGGPFVTLFTDIDNTFIRKGKESFSQEVYKQSSENNIPITAVTGNDFATVLKRIESGELPYFSAIAGSVGTELWVLHVDPDGTKRYVPDNEFAKSFIDKGYDRPAVAKLASRFINDYAQSHPNWKLDYQSPDLELNYLKDQSTKVQPFKTSFYAFADTSQSLDEMRATFQDRFPQQEIVICEEIGHNSALTVGQPKKYCIDILPITKSGVVDYIRKKTGVKISAVAGDSGNDSEMLTGAGNISIQVGGAKPELIDAVNAIAGDVSDKESGGSFTKVKQPDKSTKLYYRERGSRLGPESILHAAKILQRAQNIANIREERVAKEKLASIA